MSTSQGNKEQEVSDKTQKYKEEAEQSTAQWEFLRAKLASQRKKIAPDRSGDSQAYNDFIAYYGDVKRIDTEIIELCDSASKTQELVQHIEAKRGIAGTKLRELAARSGTYLLDVLTR